MKLPPALHRWTLSPRQAIAVQRRLAPAVIREPAGREFRFVAGLDAAFSPDGTRCIAAVVLWDLRTGTVVEEHVASRPLQFPYVPGLLTFREAPALLAGLRKLRREPDVLICDGQGLAHPRRIGIASHVGVFCGMASIGCAKSRLIGSHREPGLRRGARVPLEDGNEVIGRVLRTQDGVRPVYVSIGHQVDLETASRVVLDCATKYRLPEPTRLADRRVAEAKWSMADRGMESGYRPRVGRILSGPKA
jgi:deoxyribonuclease V